MIDNMQKVNELEREVTLALDLTPREERLLEALHFMIDAHYGRMRTPLSELLKNYHKERK